MKYIISVLSPDKPGIVYHISNAIFKNDGNINDLSQNVLKGYFTGVFYTDFNNVIDIDKLKKDINVTDEYQVNIVPFEKHHNIKSKQDNYVLTAKCTEQKGIVSAITGYLFEKNINIENFSAFTENDEFVIVSLISVPSTKDAFDIKNDIKEIGKDWNLSVHLSHENIYLATNTVCPTVRVGKVLGTK